MTMIENMKSNIKSKEFYAEADQMSDGWGGYLKSIDTLKDDVHNKKDIVIDDACWILYAEGHCSSVWYKFKDYCIKNKWEKREMPWEAWKGLFHGWQRE